MSENKRGGMADPASGYYDARYFAWQSSIGEFGGWGNLPKFTPYVTAEDEVLDFGCGGGFLLRNLTCRKRVGVEVNPAAAAAARALGVEVHADLADVPDDYVDVAISNHALEHTSHPLRELQQLRTKVRVGGRIVFYVPCESVAVRYRPGDISHHLYSWSPLCLGNLFGEAGLRVKESVAYPHHWPPGYRQIARWGGRPLFEVACRVWGRLVPSIGQVRVVAERAADG